MDQSNPVKRTGIIGLGAMGLQMARHMAAKGFDVLGNDVADDVTKRAQAHRIRTGDAAAVARHAEVVIVMVATDAQVEEVAGLLLPQLARGSVICIASSVAPDTCRTIAARAAERDIDVLDTPVVLGQEAANDGTATIYVGGEGRGVSPGHSRCWLRSAPRCCISARRGPGQIAKIVNNLLLWTCMSANFEAMTLARALGADIPRLIEALGHGSGANWSLSRWGKSTGKWSEKDMDVALDLAQAAKVPMPLSGLVDQLIKGVNQERMKALMS